jgi:tetratricopeptide (TPR) repeat protein
MMRLRAIFCLVAVGALAFAAGDASAQKFPERRTTRQGTKLYGKGDYTGAETLYRQAAEMNPELREARFNLAGALWRQAQGEATTETQAGEQSEAQQAAQGKLQEAADIWTGLANDSLAPAPMVSQASYNAGNVALAGQQIDPAIEAYKQALRLRPDDMEAKFNLAYAQKMKQQQEQNENQDQNDQNQDQNQDQNNPQGGQGENDQQQGDGENNPQEGNNDPKEGQGENDQQDGEGDTPPPPSGQDKGQGEAKIDPQTAQQMLDAMQAAEDDTREKVNAKEVQVGARSGKNW